MTAKVYSFSKEKARKAKQPPKDVFEKSIQTIYAEVLDDVLGEWQQAAARNKLNELVVSKLPPKLKGEFKDQEIIYDLNTLSKIEQKLGMKIVSMCPGHTTHNQVGWLVAFYRGKEVFATPPDMASEAVGRALNIVLCITFEKTLKTLGRT